MARPPPELPDEIVEEFLLRFPPDDPACLFRASLACKRWCRLISNPRFRRRFREFHRSPPLLGAIYGEGSATRYWPTSSFRPPYLVDRDNCRAIDSRHGRILYCYIDLVVLDPVTGQEWKVPEPPQPHQFPLFRRWSAALLCAAPGCDHLICPPAVPSL